MALKTKDDNPSRGCQVKGIIKTELQISSLDWPCQEEHTLLNEGLTEAADRVLEPDREGSCGRKWKATCVSSVQVWCHAAKNRHSTSPLNPSKFCLIRTSEKQWRYRCLNNVWPFVCCLVFDFLFVVLSWYKEDEQDVGHLKLINYIKATKKDICKSKQQTYRT